MSELSRRVAVAVVGIPAVLGLAYLGGWFLAVPIAGFAAWGAHECYRLASVQGLGPLGVVGSATSAGFVLLAAWRPVFADFAPWALALVGVSTGVTLVAAMLCRPPDQHPLAASAIAVFGSVYAGLSLSFIPLLRGLPGVEGWAEGEAMGWPGLFIVALPLVTTWVGDGSAFFAGTAWGKKKLAPTISPNKSWVGFWADLIGASVAAVLWMILAQPLLPGLDLGGLWVVALIGALLGVAGVIGDLVESLLKRGGGAKDSGTFFPGHGGVLDRIDSLIFAIPIAYCSLVLVAG